MTDGKKPGRLTQLQPLSSKEKYLLLLKKDKELLLISFNRHQKRDFTVFPIQNKRSSDKLKSHRPVTKELEVW